MPPFRALFRRGKKPRPGGGSGGLAPPDAPTLAAVLTATAHDRLTATWADNSAVESLFRYQFATDAGFTAVVATDTVGANATSATGTGLSASTLYYFRVRAENAAGNSAWSNTDSETTTAAPSGPAAAPGTPTFDSLAQAGTRNRLTVTPADANADGFVILRTTGGKYHECGRAPATAAQFTWDDYQTQANTAYGYKVAALRGTGGLSGYSATRTVTTTDFLADAPGDPSNLRVYARDDESLEVHWDVPTTGETGNVLEVSSDGGSTWPVTLNPPAGWTFYAHTGLTAGTTRHYRLKRTAQGGAVASGYSNTASGTTLAAGQCAYPSGTIPPFLWTVELLQAMQAAKTAYEGNPSGNTLPIKTWAKIVQQVAAIGTADAPGGGEDYPLAVPYVAAHYVVTGDAASATKVFNRMPFNETNGTFCNGTVTAVTSNSQITLSVTGRNFTDDKVWFHTGANADVGYEARLVTACNTVTGEVTLDAALEQAPQVGDQFTAVDTINITQNLSQTQHVPLWVLPLGEVYPGLTADQTARWTRFINTASEANFGTRNPAYMGGFGAGDSDQTVSNYFGLHLWDILGPLVGNTRTAWCDRTNPAGVVLGGSSPVGGLPDVTTVRKTLAQYGAQARGGSWPEGTQYNTATLPHALWGVRGAYTAAGTDNFPELTRALNACARVFSSCVVPGRARVVKWADTDAAHGGIHQPNFVGALALMATFTRGQLDVSPHLQDLVYEYWIGDNGYSPFGNILARYDSSIPRSDYLTRPLYHAGAFDQRHEAVIRGGSLGTDSTGGLLTFAEPNQSHTQTWMVQFTRDRLGERCYRAPEAYSDLSGGLYGTNNLLASGLDIQRHAGFGGPVAWAGGTTWAYAGSSSGGPYYDAADYAYPPSTYLHDMTRAVVQLPGVSAKHSDVIVVFDRVLCQDPKKLTNCEWYGYSGYTAVTVQSGATATSIPTNANGGASADLLADRRWLILDNGNVAKQPAKVTASTAGANTTLTVRGGDLGAAPVAGSSGYVYFAGVMHYAFRADALAMTVWHCEVNPTLDAGVTRWTTTGGQKCEVVHVLPASVQRRAYAVLDEFPASCEPSEGKYSFLVYGPTAYPSDTQLYYYEFLSVASVSDDTYQPTVTGLTGTGSVAKGVLVTRAGENDWVAMFGAKREGRVLFAGYSVTYTQATATADVLFCDLDPAKAWSYTVDGGASNPLTVGGSGTAKFTVSGTGAHTLALAAA